MQGSGKHWSAGCRFDHLRQHRVGSGALVCTVTAATGGQARVILGFKRDRKRPQQEEKRKEDGEQTPHLKFMVHEDKVVARHPGDELLAQVSSMHRISSFLPKGNRCHLKRELLC
jgi:hypothetical protein